MAVSEVREILKQENIRQKAIFADLYRNGAYAGKDATKTYLLNNKNYWAQKHNINPYLDNLKNTYQDVHDRICAIRASFHLPPETAKQFSAEVILASVNSLTKQDLMRLQVDLAYNKTRKSTGNSEFRLLCRQSRSFYFVRLLKGLYDNTYHLKAVNAAIDRRLAQLQPATSWCSKLWLSTEEQTLPEDNFTAFVNDDPITVLKFIESNYRAVLTEAPAYVHKGVVQMQELLVSFVSEFFDSTVLSYFRQSDSLNQLIDRNVPPQYSVKNSDARSRIESVFDSFTSMIGLGHSQTPPAA